MARWQCKQCSYVAEGSGSPTKCDSCSAMYSFRNMEAAHVAFAGASYKAKLTIPTAVDEVHLKLTFKDPENKERPLPKGFKVNILSEGVGDPLASTIAGDDGVLTAKLEGNRRGKPFTLQFKSDAVQYVVCEERGGATPEQQLVTEADVKALADQGKRAFRLPDAWALKHSDWVVDGNPEYFKDYTFQKSVVGTAAKPLKLTLDLHWQYVRLEYFDRYVGHTSYCDDKPISILPVTLDGFHIAPPIMGPPPQPDARSNWTIGQDETRLVQCVPWIVRRDDAGKDLAKPDRESSLSFSTDADHRYIETTEAVFGDVTRTYAKLDTTAANACGADRLRYYDLPEHWRSRRYFARLSDAANEQGWFEDMVAKPTTADKPLIFSLDDIVLTDENLKPLDPSLPANDPRHWNVDMRVAIFSHKFAGTGLASPHAPPAPQPPRPPLPPPGAGLPNLPEPITPPNERVLSKCGLYNPDENAKLPYLSRHRMRTNYIADYPHWTRLVVVDGSLFDVFGRRTGADASIPDGVVGARAAVRWLPVTNAVRVPAGTALTPRPPLTAADAHPHFSIQPYYQQEFFARSNSRAGTGLYDEWSSPIAAGDGELYQNARFDMAHLRCCDYDGEDEVAVVFRLHRFNFNFTAETNDLDDAALNAQPPAQRLETRERWTAGFLVDCVNRWNGDDGVNSDRAWIVSKSGNPKLRTAVITFVQRLDDPGAHFRINLIREAGTSAMSASPGTGKLRVAAGRDTANRGFAGAHETGHTGGQPDEYASSANAEGQTGFGSNHIPGSPFILDTRAMMKFNREVRARYFWQVAEWLRTLPNLRNAVLRVEHGTERYELPHYQHAATRPGRSYTFWPIRAKLRHAPADPVLYDSYLYLLGKDRYSTLVLPGLTGAVGHIDGILVVMLKMQFQFDDYTDVELVRQVALNKIQQKVDNALNRRCFAAFSSGGGANDPPDLTRCMLHFSFRYSTQPAAGPHIGIIASPGGALDWDGAGDPRVLTVDFPAVAPADDPTWHACLDYMADITFEAVCQLLGLNPDSDPNEAESYAAADSYKDIVRSVMGNGVNPAMTRIP